jgi:predicted CXXCH cytochrome family protein
MGWKRPAKVVYLLSVLAFLSFCGEAFAADDSACLECHGSAQQVTDAASAMDLKLSAERIQKLVVHAPTKGNVHQDLACLDCHPKATELPHPAGMLAGNPCVACHDDELKQLNTSAHRDPRGGDHLRAECWACHSAHDVRPPSDPKSTLAPFNVASRCLACHNRRDYLIGVHGQAIQFAGLNFAATCVSCHGGHDILAPSIAGSRVARRNISFTCGKCHGRVAETYRKSVHGAALMATDNPDVPTCVDCHKAHATVDPLLPQFRLTSPQICGRCHSNPKIMDKYGISTAVYSTYVADFHGTTAVLFRAVTPDQPLNQAVCYDCHGFHDVQAISKEGKAQIEQRLLVRCQVCHPRATTKFLSAWTDHYVPSPTRYPLIYWVRQFYRVVIPGTIGFFLLYIGVDVWGRRRHRRRSS